MYFVTLSIIQYSQHTTLQVMEGSIYETSHQGKFGSFELVKYMTGMKETIVIRNLICSKQSKISQIMHTQPFLDG